MPSLVSAAFGPRRWATCSERHSRIPAQNTDLYLPATLPDDADSSKFESEAVAAPLFSTQVDPFYWIWRRGPILKASTIGSPARRYQLIHKNLISAISIRDPAHNSMALPSSRCTSTLDVMGPPILLCDSDGTSHSLLSLITLPIPFPDYSQHLPHHQHL